MATDALLSPRCERKHWWVKNRKLLDKQVREARSLMATQEPKAVAAAVGVLDAVLSIAPKFEVALELKARSLLFLRRFRDVANMLHDYIPSYRLSAVAGDDSSSSSLSSSGSGVSSIDGRERAKILPSGEEDERAFLCFSISDLKRKVVAGLHSGCEGEAGWRYLILGQACYHLGLMEDAMFLLQTSRRLATAAFRRQSISHSDDTFIITSTLPPFGVPDSRIHSSSQQPCPPLSESASVLHLLAHVKLLHRRRTTATAALEAGLPHEAARHFSKILDGRRGTPHSFAVACLVGRASAFRDAGRVADAIADCNSALAIEPTSVSALRVRADLLESVRCLGECIRDLDHLKLLHDAVLRDRKLPGPPWRPPHREANCQRIADRIRAVRQRASAGGGNDIDYHKLIGVRVGCARWEVERAHLVLSLRHKPENAGEFIDRLEFSGEHRDLGAVRDQAKMSALILYRWLQKGYAAIVASISIEKQRTEDSPTANKNSDPKPRGEKPVFPPPVCRGVFCRDVASAESVLSCGIPVKREALSC